MAKKNPFSNMRERLDALLPDNLKAAKSKVRELRGLHGDAQAYLDQMQGAAIADSVRNKMKPPKTGRKGEKRWI